ncbi:PREDICTED: LOB domain-containing protein 16-like [Tarenaya hassleriana]|uniref:LOB domain-containing protein 16-like n=1 Tax=Tarenaya hassleriana TaxID=28532 RepID=UPI00053C0F05|nr:PREDICTED: LOB domain-containing protein 16-like [Tarenaya hassleriana]
MASSGNSVTVTGSPCGACKFLRRKCLPDCIFSPYFSSEELGPARFAAIHRVYGASNVCKLLLNVPVRDRFDAVVSIAYEAEARLSDPVYGCVSHIFALQQQVAVLQAQAMQLKAQLAHHNIAISEGTRHHTWQQTSGFPVNTTLYNPYGNVSPSPVSPQSSLESLDQSSTSSDVSNVQERRDGFRGLGFREGYSDKRRSVTHCNSDSGELQALALRMMRN